MSRATLAILLSKLQQFPKPKTYLEQYITPSEAAATILWDAHTRNLIAGKHVIDLGAGPGILGIGAMILGAKKVTFVEIDGNLEPIIKENITSIKEEVDLIEEQTHEIIIADVTKELDIKGDLVLTNPPFGTKQKNADTAFLEAATTIAPEYYSFHKTTTINYLEKWLNKRKIFITQKFPYTFNLAKTMKQHEKKAHHVTITCLHSRKDL